MKREVDSRGSGFSMLELIVVLALLVGAAGIVFPLVSAEIRDSKISRALDDTGRIAGAILRAARDAGAIPGTDDPAMPPTVLLTQGKLPSGVPLGRQRRLADVLGVDSPFPITRNPWNGPYLGEVGQDPWRRAYVVLVPAAKAGMYCWALSAGPDGTLQTTERSLALEGDDVGICVR